MYITECLCWKDDQILTTKWNTRWNLATFLLYEEVKYPDKKKLAMTWCFKYLLFGFYQLKNTLCCPRLGLSGILGRLQHNKMPRRNNVEPRKKRWTKKLQKGRVPFTDTDFFGAKQLNVQHGPPACPCFLGSSRPWELLQVWHLFEVVKLNLSCQRVGQWYILIYMIHIW